MSALTNYGEDLALDTLLAGTVYIALHTGDPGEDADQNEVTTAQDADYARKSATFAAGTGPRTLSAPVSWTVASTSAGYTVTHISIWDAATAGNPLFKGPLLWPVSLVADEAFDWLGPGTLVIELD